MLEGLPCAGGLVLENHRHAPVKIAGDFESVADEIRIECRFGENCGIRPEEYGRAAAARSADAS